MRNTRNRVAKGKKKKAKLTHLLVFISITTILLISSGFLLFRNVQASNNNLTANKQTAQSSAAIKPKNNTVVNAVQTVPAENKNSTESPTAKPSDSEAKPEAQTQPQQPTQQAQPTQQPSTAVTPTPADGSKVAYLTFDDGPSSNNTPKILEILKNENIKATFFVIGSMAEKNPSLLKREIAEGHAIGNHTYSHNIVYNHSTPQCFIEDLKKGDSVITSIIGNYDKTLIRFPGGSYGHTAYINAVTAAGYHYVDWNCLNGDAEVALAPVDTLLRRFHETYKNQKSLIILMHDAPAKVTTPEALPQIIKFLKEQGYVFKTL